MDGRAHYHHGDLRRALVEVTQAQVQAHGVHGFSLRAAARSAQVDPAAVYRHFASKEALLAAVAVVQFGVLADRMETAIEDAERPEAAIWATGDAYLRYALEEPNLFRLMFGPFGAGGNRSVRGTGRGRRDPYRIMVDALRSWAEAEGIRLSMEEAVWAAWSAVHGLAHLLVDGNVPQEQVEAALRAVLGNVLAGLRGARSDGT